MLEFVGNFLWKREKINLQLLCLITMRVFVISQCKICISSLIYPFLNNCFDLIIFYSFVLHVINGVNYTCCCLL
jgi:hypothetical protein